MQTVRQTWRRKGPLRAGVPITPIEERDVRYEMDSLTVDLNTNFTVVGNILRRYYQEARTGDIQGIQKNLLEMQTDTKALISAVRFWRNQYRGVMFDELTEAPPQLASVSDRTLQEWVVQSKRISPSVAITVALNALMAVIWARRFGRGRPNQEFLRLVKRHGNRIQKKFAKGIVTMYEVVVASRGGNA